MTTVERVWTRWACAPLFRDWLAPLVVFALARIASAVMMVHLAESAESSPDSIKLNSNRGTGADPLSMVTFWDGRWYEVIATSGYPDGLPRDGDGKVIQNAWAFYPVFPSIAATLMRTGVSFEVAAMTLSLACGAGSMVLLYRMLAPGTGRFTALLTVTAVSWGYASPVFQVAYTEGLALLLVLSAMWALRERRYVLAGVAALVLSLSRPIAPALAAVLAIAWLLRWRRREVQAFPRNDRVKHALLAAATASAFFIWPGVCAIATGELDAYAQTQSAWQVGDWGGLTWLGLAALDPGALFVAVVILAIPCWLAVRGGSTGWGSDLRTWVFAYPLFILAVSRPTTSVFRYLMLTTVPAWPFPDVSSRILTTRSRAALLLGVIAVATTIQYFWLKFFFIDFVLAP